MRYAEQLPDGCNFRAMAVFWDLTNNDFCFVYQNLSLLVKRRRWFDHWCYSSKQQLQMFFSWFIRREGLCSRDAGGKQHWTSPCTTEVRTSVLNLHDKLCSPYYRLELLNVSAFRNCLIQHLEQAFGASWSVVKYHCGVCVYTDVN